MTPTEYDYNARYDECKYMYMLEFPFSDNVDNCSKRSWKSEAQISELTDKNVSLALVQVYEYVRTYIPIFVSWEAFSPYQIS